MAGEMRDEKRDGGGARGEETSRPPEALSELVEISRAVGSDPDLVQGGGGNTSVKSRDLRTIYVKASGVPLAEMDSERGWAEMDLGALLAILEREGLGSLPAREREAEVMRLLAAAVRRPAGARPSVESCLHAILDRVAIHVHPVHLNAFLSSLESRERFREMAVGLGVEPLYVPYVDPGFLLASRLDREIREYRRAHGRPPPVIFLENHGAFFAAGEAEECLRLLRSVVERGKAWAGPERVNPETFDEALPPGPGKLAELRGALMRSRVQPILLRRDDSAFAEELIEDPALVRAAREGAFTPDQIVYCRTHPLVVEAEGAEAWAREAAAYRERHGVDPAVVLKLRPSPDGVPAGVYYAASDLGRLRVVAETYRAAVFAIARSGRGGGPRFLSREQASFIESWEAEHYRAAVLGGGRARFSGRIAAVTGAASGLGKGIALALASAGATVFALDVNADALRAARAEAPPRKFVPVAADVTSEESVIAAFRTVEASAGGIDFLVNAAGIAPSYPLVEFPFAAWKKTLDINLSGYFLCAREAARIMLRQGIGGAIVNLTSKSGLEASKDNSAYNATKAGEIHLMRGWALELGRAGIRVNCVAPGNVFKGSQIWNPEYIKAAAKKKGIRPEEVIPYYVSLSALGREIEPEDVANAVAFLLSDEARRITGQTLVVDGGQVMVR